MPDAHSNFAVSTLANAPGTGGTSFVVSSGEGSRFPAVPFNATVWPAAVQANPSNAEIVRVTAISSDTLTVTRNANFLTGDVDKGGSAQNVAIGWQIAATITKKTLFDIENPLSIMQKLGSMTFMGHSYIAGSTQTDSGTPNVYKESAAAKLMAMLNIHEHNVYHLAQAGSCLMSPNNIITSSTMAGWLTALQYFYPHNAAAVNSANDLVLSDPVAASLSGALTIVHGHNDLMLGMPTTGITQAIADEVADVNLRAAKHAIRTILSRHRAGAVYTYVYPNGGGSIVMDSSVAFGETWAGPTASVILNSGAGYNHTVDWTGTTGNFTITIPANFTGGTVAVCLIAQEGGVTTLSAGESAGATSGFGVTERGYFPQSGTFPVRVLAEGANSAEDLLVTAGHGTGAGDFTVQAIGGGGTASAHGAGAVIRSARNMHRCTWGGTATLETGSDISESSDGTVANVVTPDGTGITYLSGQGGFGKRVAVTTRFKLTASAAGTTITGSMTGRFNTNDSAADMRFDSWWIEDSDPPPAVLSNIQDYFFAAFIRADAATYGQRPITTYIPNWNAMLEDVASEFQDGFVRVADVWTPFHNRNGTIGTTMTAVEASPTSISWTPYDSTFVPKKGMSMFFGGGYQIGGSGGDKSEAVIIAADPVYVGPHWTLSLTRAAHNTTQRAHTSGDWLGSSDWVFTGAATAGSPYDFLHLNQRGHAVFAEAIFQEFASMPEPSTYQLASVVGNWSQNSQQISQGVVDDYLYPCPQSGSLANAAVALNTQWAVPVYIPKLSICTKISYQVATGGTSSTVRMGIFMPDLTHARPGRLLTDFGTASTTGTGEEVGPTGYQVLHPGWYWISGVNNGTAAPSTRNLPVGGQPVQISIPSGTAITGSSVALGVQRTSVTDQTTFDAAWSSWTFPIAAGNIPKMWLRLRTVNFA